VEAEFLSAWEALEMEQHEHFELRATVELLCDALGTVQVHPRAGTLRGRLGAAFEWVRTQVKEALHLGMRRAFTVFRSHYQKIDLVALSRVTSSALMRSLMRSMRRC
jgi:hypothetical protein